MAPTPSANGRARRLRLTRFGPVVLAAALLLFGYYAWTASSSGDPFNKVTPYQFKYGDSDYYNLLADAFLHGRLSLDVPVDPVLAAADNPYDPYLAAARLGDASFYNDHYYLSWGPAPALTTFLPVRLVGMQLRENLAVVLYCFFGVLLACASLSLLLRRLVPGAARLVHWAGYASLALAGVIPWLLRRPTVYEVSLTGAFCFSMAGMYVLLRETLRSGQPRMTRLALAGVLYGLAVLSRPTTGLIAVAMAGVAYLLRHDGHVPRGFTRIRVHALALAVGIPILAGVVFMIYNAVRFSGPLDFGSKYQFGGRDTRFLPYNQIRNLPPSLFGYLVAPLRIGLEFPYVHLPPPPPGPFKLREGFAVEQTGSVFWSLPLVLLALAVLGRSVLDRVRSRAALTPPIVARIVAALLAVAALPLVAGSYAIPGYTERYEIDFLPYLTIAAVIGWAELARRAATRRRAAWWRRGGAVLAVYGVIIGVAIGFTGYYDDLRTTNRGAFEALERFFSPLPTLVTAVAGHPVISGAIVPGGQTPAPIGYTTLGPGNSTFTLRPDAPAKLTIVSPNRRHAQLRFSVATDVPGRFVVTATAHQRSVGTTVRNGALAGVDIELRRGINYVDLTLAPAADVAVAAGAVQPSVLLQAIRVQ